MEVESALLDGVRLMLAHAMETGRPVSPQWIEAAQVPDGPLSPDDVRRLGRAHDALAALVAPATPRSLRYIAQQRHVKMFRSLGVLGGVFLAGFIGLSLDPDVGAKSAEFEAGFGHELFVNEMFQLCAAGLGATFASLFALTGGLRDYSLDTRDRFASLVRILLGVVAGIVLAQLAPFDGQGRTFGRPLLALLGGFSVDVVHQMLRRLVELASSLVAPVADTAEADRARSDARESQVKVGVAQRLVRVRSAMPEGAAATEVDALIEDLAPSGAAPADPDLALAVKTAPARRRAPA